MGVAEKMVEAGGQKEYWAGEVEIVSKDLFVLLLLLFFFCSGKCGSEIIAVTIPYFG